MNISNLTCEEQFRIYGVLSGDKVVEVLDSFSKIEKLNGLSDTVSEANGCFTGEDFLHEQIKDLNFLLKSVRGSNKELLAKIIEELEDVREETYSNSEHGRDELRNVRKALNSAGC